MRQSLFILFVIAFIACNEAPASVKNKTETAMAFDASKEQAAIMAVIEKETSSFYAGDYEGWKSTRAQQPYDFQGWNNSDGTFGVENGWQTINDSLKNYIAQYKDSKRNRPDVINKNVSCKFYGEDCAYLTWDEYSQIDSTQTYHHSKDLRLMEKQNGEWKIVTVASFWDYKNIADKNGIQ